MRKIILCCLLIMTAANLSAQIKKQLKQIQQQLLTNYQIEEGKQLLEKVAKKIKPTHNKYGHFLYLQANLMYLQGEYVQANELVQRAMKLLPLEQQIEALTFRGNLLTELGQFRIADSLLNIAHGFYVNNELDDPLMEAKVIVALGLLKVEEQQYALADSLYNLAMFTLERVGSNKQETTFQLLCHIGESQLQQGQMVLAQATLEKAENTYINSQIQIIQRTDIFGIF